jgi:hypothetical protein
MAILPMSIDHFLKPVHYEAAAVKECPNAQKRAAVAMKSERNSAKKESRGILRWLL